MRVAPTVTINDPSDPFSPSGQTITLSQSLTFSEDNGRVVSVVSFPEATYQPATISVLDLAKCEPRSAGQAPPFGKKIGEFPLPTSGSAHLHPNAILSNLSGEAPPTPPATVTKGYFTGSTGAKTPVSQIRQLFDHNKANTISSLQVPRHSVAASSFYSCDEQGHRVAGEEEDEEQVVGRQMPQEPAPGGAIWF